MYKPELYIHTGRATHFLRWEIKEFKRHFRLVEKPNESTALLCFGPDVLREASRLPALKRFAVLFPGFGHNPLYNDELLPSQLKIIEQKYEHIFINKGPLQIAYKDLKPNKVSMYPFSIDILLLGKCTPRVALENILHLSNDAPQKDWPRSERIMKKTGMLYEVYPPRDGVTHEYITHEKVIEKYKEYDSFVHVAKDINSKVHIDGKYTASFIEAGATGAILFWHDTFGLGNDLKTVFELPLDEAAAADRINEIRKNLNVKRHSKRTMREMRRMFNPRKSVTIRARKIKSLL